MKPTYKQIEVIDCEKSGATLREYREDHNITLSQVAQQLNKSVTYCSQIERGKASMTEKQFSQYFGVLNVLSHQLLQDPSPDTINPI